MSRTPQDIYASNLLRGQSFGYPLRDPKPNDKSDLEGFRIGDVGYIDDYGEFNWIFNIRSLPKELLEDGIHNLPLDLPAGKQAFTAEKVFMAGVKQVLEEPRYIHIIVNVKVSLLTPCIRANYAFTTTSSEGAIFILPDGASRFELGDKRQLEEIREYVKKHALQWCRFTKQDTLYLITAVFKSKSWTLGSFHNGSHGDKIFIHRRSCDTSGSSIYHWKGESNVDSPVPPTNNAYLNQTVLLKGFKVTVRWDWLPIVERAERTEWWVTSFLASLWSTISQGWLPQVGE